MHSNFIFNIGFNKSGTKSLALALNLLGIPSLHHYSNDNITPLNHLIKNNQQANKKLLHGLDETYCGFCDFGGFDFYQNIFYQYPNSKFILTVRPVDDWIKSLSTNFENINNQNDLEVFYNKSKQYYEKNLFDVRKFFKDHSHQFLELRICEGEGWQNLCGFIEKDIPIMPFPWKNKTQRKAKSFE